MRDRRVYEWDFEDVRIRLVDPPQRLGQRKEELTKTAESWRGYALRRYGPDVQSFMVLWGAHGIISQDVVMRPGTVPEKVQSAE